MLNLFRLLPWSVLSLTLVLPASVFGQEASESKEEEEEKKTEISPQSYEVVVEDSVSYRPSLNTVVMKLPIPLQSTPASVGVVTAPLFQNQDATILGDALRNVSGVLAHTGFGVHDFFTIRGFDSLSGGLVLTDSAPEPEVTFYHLYNVERIEVLKGPSAFLYGGNPLSGSVNLVRKQPLFENSLQLGGAFGYFETYRGSVDLNRVSSDGSFAFRLNVFGQDSDNYRDDKDNRQFGVNPALTWTLGGKSSLAVNFEYINSDYKSDSGLPLVNNNQIPDVARTRSYQSPFDFSDQEIYRVRLDFNTVVNDFLTLRNKFYFTDLDWRSAGTLFSGVFPNQQGSLDVFRFLSRLDDRQKLVGNQFEGLFSISTGTVSHNLLAGFEFNRLGDEFTLDVAFLPPIDLFNPVERATEPLFPLPGQLQAADARSLVFAPYLVDQIALSEQVQLFLGGRLDVIDYDDKATATLRNDSQFSPLLGLVYAPNPQLSFYVNGGKAFAPPSTLVVGERKPEESTQYEVGVKKQFQGGKIDTTLAFYHLEKNNIAIPDQSGVTRQTGDQRSRGIELDFAGELALGWYVFASYAFNEAELTDFSERIIISFNPFSAITLDRSGNRAAFAPKHLFNFWTVKEFRNGVSVGGGGRYISDQFIAEDNAFKIDGVFTLDATLAYRFNNWRWSLNFKNITDRKYETRGFRSTSVIPANPFALYARVELGM
ncbi:TonB-dependent siderophore receptor [Acidobacteria bacterium AH-259-G07]|nr:TonB-dependent siderophore receptor [Acidobacteria bacterium AH-259-G07]